MGVRPGRFAARTRFLLEIVCLLAAAFVTITAADDTVSFNRDVRTILADNPAELYGFDVEVLQPVANRVCPTTSELIRSA